MKVLLAVVAVTALLYLASQQGQVDQTSETSFNDFIMKFRKSYFSKDEFEFRKSVFITNLAQIALKNLNKKDKATYGLNQMSDWTTEEFESLLGFTSNEDQPSAVIIDQGSDQKTHSHKDWRKDTDIKGAKDQLACGACWAFAATGAIEATHRITNGVSSVNLSEQELLDCSKNFKYFTLGCLGGHMNAAFKMSRNHKGLNSEEDYPYIHKRNKKCGHQKKVHSQVIDYIQVTDTTMTFEEAEANMKAALDIAPLTTGIAAHGWQHYKKGVFSCEGTFSKDHAVLVIGYTEAGHWIIRNSWGSRWGDQGYITIAAGNTCLLLDDAVRVVVATV